MKNFQLIVLAVCAGLFLLSSCSNSASEGVEQNREAIEQIEAAHAQEVEGLKAEIKKLAEQVESLRANMAVESGTEKNNPTTSQRLILSLTDPSNYIGEPHCGMWATGYNGKGVDQREEFDDYFWDFSPNPADSTQWVLSEDADMDGGYESVTFYSFPKKLERGEGSCAWTLEGGKGYREGTRILFYPDGARTFFEVLEKNESVAFFKP